jgi:lipopolysaccharide biosynthesis glycosyltransferase
MEDRIHISLASDSNGIHAMATAIVSALHNKNSSNFYVFHLFLSGEVEGDLQQKLRDCIKGFESSCQINLLNLKDKFSNITLASWATYVTYFRLVIPSSLPNLERIIYIDTDILVRHDLSELWNFDIGENYIAAVPDSFGGYFSDAAKRKERMKAGFTDLNFYINAGVLLMNLKKIREDNIEQKCLEKVGDKRLRDDQFILNYICYPKIAFLHCKWNFTENKMRSYNGYIRRYDIFYSPGELNEAWSNPAIFHWIGPKKPWKYYDLPLAHEWFRYYLKTPMGGEILQRETCMKGKIRRFIQGIIGLWRDGNVYGI